MKMPFGKFKGISVDEIPRSYLVWAFETVKLEKALYSEIAGLLDLKIKPQSNPKRWKPSAGELYEDAIECVIKQIDLEDNAPSQ